MSEFSRGVHVEPTDEFSEALDLLEHCTGCDLIYSAYDNGLGLRTTQFGVEITETTTISDLVKAFLKKHGRQ